MNKNESTQLKSENAALNDLVSELKKKFENIAEINDALYKKLFHFNIAIKVRKKTRLIRIVK